MKKIKFIKPIIFTSFLYLFLLIFTTLKAYNNFDGYPQTSFINYKILVIGIISLTMLPIIFYTYSEEEKKYYPIFYLIIIYFSLTYCSYYILDYDHETLNGELIYSYRSSPADVYYSLKLLFLGLIALNVGYFLCKTIIKRKLNFPNILKIVDDKEVLYIFLIINFGILFFFYFLESNSLITRVYQAKYPLIYFSISLTFLLFVKSSNIYKLFLLIPFLIIFFLELSVGSNVFPFMILFFFYTLYVGYRKKFLITPIILILISGLTINAFKEDYRKITWNPKLVERSKSILYKFDAFIFSFKNYYSNIKISEGENSIKQKVLLQNLIRINHSASSLVLVSKSTPEKIPYLNGESYKILLTKLVPRLVWNNKPSDEAGNKFGHIYKVLQETDNSTSWNMPTFNEFYSNYGLKGIIVGMFILGFITRLLMILFPFEEKNNYILLIGFTMLYPLFFLENHLSLVIGAVAQSFVFLIIVTIICKILILQIRKIFSNEKKNN